MDKIDFAGSWESFWGAVTKAANIDGLLLLLGIIGMLLVLVAVIAFLFKKRTGRSGGEGTNGLVITLLIGCILALPSVLIPIVLGIVDVVANGVIGVLGLGG